MKMAMKTILKDVYNYVLDKIEQENKELIDEIIYTRNQPEAYARSFEFRDAWGSDVNVTADGVTATFSYKPDNLTYDPEANRHGTLESGFIGQYLAEIIYEGKSGLRFGNGFWTEERDAWTPLLKVIDKNIDRWIEEGFNKFM